MKAFGSLCFAGLLLGVTACSTMNTQRDFDRNAHFDQYRTYGWAPEPNTQAISPELDQTVRAAVDKGLVERGYTKTQGKAPDFYVVYHITGPQRTDVRHYTDWGFGTAFRAGYSYYVGWPGNPRTYAVLEQERFGALVLDFVEVRRDQLVWRGVASSVVSAKPEQTKARADEAVRLLLAHFPPPAQPPSQ
jgi:hypothetical protein